MLMLGTTIGSTDKLRKHCIPGIQRAADGESYAIMVEESHGHVPAALQRIVERARTLPDVEALVLLNTDLEILDMHFARKVRDAIAAGYDAVGLVGTTVLSSLFWWEHGPKTWRGYAVDGRGGRTVVDGGFAEGDPCPVQSVDGMLFVLSRRAIETVDFHPELYTGLHGYVEEACMQFPGRVCVTRIEAFHHTQGGYAGGIEAFEQANAVWKSRWAK